MRKTFEIKDKNDSMYDVILAAMWDAYQEGLNGNKLIDVGVSGCQKFGNFYINSDYECV